MVRVIQIGPNKSLECQVEVGRAAHFNPFEFSLLATTEQDHAGVSCTCGIRGVFWFCVKVYDHRHWDTLRGTWERG